MGKLVFFTVFFTITVFGYFVFTLEEKLPNHREKIQKAVTKDIDSKRKKNNKIKAKKLALKDFSTASPAKNLRKISSIPNNDVKKEKFLLDKAKLRENLNLSEEELEGLSNAMERIIDNSNQALQNRL